MKQIVVCSVSNDILSILDKTGHRSYMSFYDEPSERGEVKLVRFLREGGQPPDLVLVDAFGTAGLSACDYLRSRLTDVEILWICDREEFKTEAARMAVDFFYKNPKEQGNMEKLLEIIGQIVK